MKKLSIIILALAIAFAPAFALPWLNNPSSVAAKTTYWNFQEDIDYFSKLNKFQTVEFKDFLTYAQFNTRGIEAGFGIKRDIYFAASYYGNLWSINQNGATLVPGSSLNSVNLVFGFNNFGIAAYGFFIPRNVQYPDDDGTQINASESVFLGSLGFGGMTLETKSGLKFYPFAKIGYFSGLNQFENKTKGTHGIFSPTGYDVRDVDGNIIYHNPGDVDGHLVFDLGTDLDLVERGAYCDGVWLYYYQDFAVYSPKDSRYNSESFDLGYWGTYDVDERLSIGYSLNPYLDFENSYSSSVINLGLPISLGLKFAAKPEKCTLYAGCLVAPIIFEQTRVNGIVTESLLNYDKTTKTNTVEAELAFGVDWNIAKDFSLAANLTLPCNPKIIDNFLNGGLGISAKLAK